MEIQYRTVKEFTSFELADLFLSVNWDSGNYPDKLQIALSNSHSVYSAWDGDKLVGLINALSDGIMTAYFHYLLVRPDYQGQGIGRQLIGYMLQDYKEYSRKVLIAYNEAIPFYQKYGFKTGEDSVPMFVTSLKT